MKCLHLLSFIIIITLLGINLFSQETDTVFDFRTQSSAYRLLGKEVPDFTAVNLSHDTINANSMKGYVSLMQFMYFPCAPCLKEVSILNVLSKNYQAKGFRVYAVIPNRPVDIESYQNPEDTAGFNVFAFYRRHTGFERIGYDIIPECPGNDIKTKENAIGVDCDPISLIFKRDSYPTSYLIDRNGIIRKVFVGFESTKMDQETSKLEQNILELLNEP